MNKKRTSFPYSQVVAELRTVLKADKGVNAAPNLDLPALRNHPTVVRRMPTKGTDRFLNGLTSALNDVIDLFDESDGMRPALREHFGLTAKSQKRTAAGRLEEAASLSGYGPDAYYKERRKDGLWKKSKLTLALSLVETYLDEMALVRADPGQEEVTLGPSDQSNLVSPTHPGSDGFGFFDLGLSQIYVPRPSVSRDVNNARNEAKIAFIAEVARRRESLTLVAESGHSYLSTRGVFFDSVRLLLENDCEFNVVLANKDDVLEQLVAAYDDDGGNPDEARARLSAKWETALFGYEELRETHRGQVNLTTIGFLPHATSLSATSLGGFYEPYFLSLRRNREAVLFNSFEMRYGSESPLAELIDRQNQFYFATGLASQ